jgi:hypothetical protein
MKENKKIEEVFKRFNSASVLSAILKTQGQISISGDEIFNLLNFELLNANTEYMDYVIGEDPYSNGFSDYIRKNGDMISVEYDPNLNLFSFNMLTKKEAEEKNKNNKTIGYFCVRRTWKNG